MTGRSRRRRSGDSNWNVLCSISNRGIPRRRPRKPPSAPTTGEQVIPQSGHQRHGENPHQYGPADPDFAREHGRLDLPGTGARQVTGTERDQCPVEPVADTLLDPAGGHLDHDLACPDEQATNDDDDPYRDQQPYDLRDVRAGEDHAQDDPDEDGLHDPRRHHEPADQDAGYERSTETTCQRQEPPVDNQEPFTPSPCDQSLPPHVAISSLRRVSAPLKGVLDRESREDRRVCADALVRVGMAGMEHRPYTTLSGGEKQRVADRSCSRTGKSALATGRTYQSPGRALSAGGAASGARARRRVRRASLPLGPAGDRPASSLLRTSRCRLRYG